MFLSVTAASRADDLVMPYACAVHDGRIALTPARATTYPVLGRRAEMAFSDCAKGPANCTTLMVHRFDIACGTTRTSWADVARAAGDLGVSLPAGLPVNFAPVGALQGRLVLPALARFSPARHSVASEALSPDSVREPADEDRSVALDAAGWRTVIEAESAGSAASGRAGTLVLALGGLLPALLAMAWAAAVHRGVAARPRLDVDGALNWAGRKSAQWSAQLRGRFLRSANRDQDARNALMNALSIATARLAETELAVASLPRALLLREVVENELDQVRGRLEKISANAAISPAQKSASQVRAALRDLERLARIAHGAAQDTRETHHQEGGAPEPQCVRMPGSVQEAYQMLGLNGDASATVAKKLVDALRMSWHPDFARDESDRDVREARMKQINAAWDLVKTRFAQAA